MESNTIDKEDTLRLTDRGLSVFKHYIPIAFRLGKNFLNPFYQDKKASCNVYYDRRNGVYKLKDFGNDDFSGDCFALIGKLHGLDCKQSKEFIEIGNLFFVIPAESQQIAEFNFTFHSERMII